MGLQVEEAHVRQIVGCIFQRATQFAVAADDEQQLGLLLHQARRIDDHAQTLLAVERAGVEADQPVFADPERGAHCGRATGGPHLRKVDPIGQKRGLVERDALGGELPHHAARDRRDGVEAAHQQALGSEGTTPQQRLAKQAQLVGGVDLEVLDVQPRARAREPGREPARRRAEQRRGHDEHDLRPPADELEQNRQARKSEARQVQDAAQTCGPGRNPDRAAVDGQAGGRTLGLVATGVVAVADAPRGVVGRCAHHRYLVAAPHQLGRHLARVLADAGELGREVEGEKNDLHGAAGSGVEVDVGGGR